VTLPWVARLSCGHQEDLAERPETGDTVTCSWPPNYGHEAQVVRAVQLRPGDEDRLMRGEAVPGARGACEREGCAHAKTRHHPRERNTREARGCYAPGGCRCPGWTSVVGEAMPPAPMVQGDLLELLAS
jgi:hypothetical protein